MNTSTENFSEFARQIATILGKENILTSEADCLAYSYDNSRIQVMPHAVVFPSSHDHVLKIVQLCYRLKIPLVARGRGTATTGASVPAKNGIVVSMERMDKIISIDSANRMIHVLPGCTNQQIQDAVAEYGFFWPPDPTSAAFCSIGGNLACNSAGPHAVKYGTCRENTLALQVVTGTGESLKCGSHTTKGVIGYDFTRLIIGSEGTLAVITGATLKLTPLPEKKQYLRIIYNNIDSATQAISLIMSQPMIPAMLEFIDTNGIQLIKQQGVELPENSVSLLLLEVDGSDIQIDETIKAIQSASENTGMIDFYIAKDAAETDKLLSARKALSPALRNIAPKKINEDVVVPVSELPRLIAGIQALSEKYQIPIVNFGHAGNGNIHTNLLFDPDDETQNKNAHLCLDELFSLVLKLNGTLSGEHGVGLAKKEYVNRELDAVNIKMMKQVKAQFDPENILNPGKMFV